MHLAPRRFHQDGLSLVPLSQAAFRNRQHCLRLFFCLSAPRFSRATSSQCLSECRKALSPAERRRHRLCIVRRRQHWQHPTEGVWMCARAVKGVSVSVNTIVRPRILYFILSSGHSSWGVKPLLRVLCFRVELYRPVSLVGWTVGLLSGLLTDWIASLVELVDWMDG